MSALKSPGLSRVQETRGFTMVVTNIKIGVIIGEGCGGGERGGEEREGEGKGVGGAGGGRQHIHGLPMVEMAPCLTSQAKFIASAPSLLERPILAPQAIKPAAMALVEKALNPAGEERKANVACRSEGLIKPMLTIAIKEPV